MHFAYKSILSARILCAKPTYFNFRVYTRTEQNDYDLFKVLQIPPTASFSEVNNIFRHLSVLFCITYLLFQGGIIDTYQNIQIF